MVNTLWSDKRECIADDEQYHTEQESLPETGHVKAGDNGTRQHDEQGIDDQGEEAERENIDWKRDQQEQWSDEGIYQAKYDCRCQGGGIAGEPDPREEIGGNEDSQGVNQPTYQKSHNLSSQMSDSHISLIASGHDLFYHRNLPNLPNFSSHSTTPPANSMAHISL